MIRYYWEEEIDNCVARMSSAMYVYGHEYLGAGGTYYLTVYLSPMHSESSLLASTFKTLR